MNYSSSSYRHAWLLAGYLTVSSVGCGGSNGTTITSDTASQSIGASGGSVAVLAGPVNGASVLLPAGALATAVTITVGEGAAAGTLPASSTTLGPVVVFGPEGQTFTSPVTITLPTTGTASAVYTRPLGGSWTAVPGAAFDAATHTIAIQVSHFSEFVPATGGTVTDAGTADVIVVTDSGPPPADASTVIDAGAGCPPGESMCGGACASLSTDAANCGACGNACPYTEHCALGVCST